MKEINKNIGEKIRLARLKNNMTQSKLADGIVTRNMLSMIENGVSTPSLGALEKLSCRLEMPIGYFLTDDSKTEALYVKVAAITKAKALFAEKRYSECSDTCKSVPFDDELCALDAICHIKLAENDMGMCLLSSAEKHLSNALKTASKTKYLSREIQGTVEALRFMISCADGDIDLDALGSVSMLPSFVPSSDLAYLATLAMMDRGDFENAEKMFSKIPFLTRERFTYFKGKRLIREMKYSKALEVLLELEGSDSVDFITKYRLLADIELCYECKRDFENAHKYANLKHRILECFRR